MKKHGLKTRATEATLSLLRRRRRGWRERLRLDEHVHLLPDIHRQLTAIEAVQHLEHARVHAFRALTGQRLLRHDVWLDADELQVRLEITVAANRRDGRGVGG